MDLYLVRHGETVDNVAGLYAGVRDSALTNHGADQAQRLGRYFAEQGVIVTHIFASPLTRARKTAEAIQSAQAGPQNASSGTNGQAPLHVTQVSDLIEQNFGYYEGRSFHGRSDPKKSGKEAHYERHKDDPGFVDMESKASMAARADAFLDNHLLPLFDVAACHSRMVVMIVSHGMLLSHLWRRLLKRLPPKSVTIAPEVTASRGVVILEHLGGWSNTGYLQLSLNQDVRPDSEEQEPLRFSADLSASVSPIPADQSRSAESVVDVSPASASRITLEGWSTVIVGIDRREHLTGLKRQRGGIGSSAYDKGQQKLDAFFKRQRKS